MISSAWTSRNRSPTLIASCSRRPCRSAQQLDDALEFGRSSGGSPRPADRGRPAAAPARRACSSRAGVDRLQQVVDRVHLERLDRVLIEGGDEDELRRSTPALEQPPRDFEAGQARHLDVEEHEVRLQLARSRAAPRGRCPPGRRPRRRRAAPSRKHSSSRASCSSSTTTARSGVHRSCGDPRSGTTQLGNLDARAGALAGHAVSCSW